jgi:hypothetical protein
MIRAELFDPTIAAHNGRLVKTTGDGLLVEFSSVVDALRCATEVQTHMAERNATVPTDRRIEFRIGINVGDIVIEDGDIFGDGVNIAARLEGLAEPGGICVSALVRRDAAGKLDLAFEDLGEQTLKNIARPLRVYRVLVAGGAKYVSQPSLALPDKPSVAVLPFTNMSGDPCARARTYKPTKLRGRESGIQSWRGRCPRGERQQCADSGHRSGAITPAVVDPRTNPLSREGARVMVRAFSTG